MLWSTFINHQYAECLVKFNDGELNMNFTHLDPLIDDDGGHGMIFKAFDNRIYLALHGPNENHDSEFYFTKFMYIPLVEDLESNTLKLDLIY